MRAHLIHRKLVISGVGTHAADDADGGLGHRVGTHVTKPPKKTITGKREEMSMAAIKQRLLLIFQHVTHDSK